MPLTGLNSIVSQVHEYFEGEDAAREKALSLSREVIRISSTAIKHVHRGEYPEAQTLIDENLQLTQDLVQSVRDYDDLRAAGFVVDALKEHAEAMITYAVVLRLPLPSLDTPGLDAASYVNGLAEAVGELRRNVLDNIRHGNVEVSEELLDDMDEAYYTLVAFDFPEAVTRGLRRRTDSVRAIIERTRGDLTGAIRQRELVKTMEKLEEKLERS